jgi:uncharacterized protein (TIGR04255 family)
LSTEGGLALSPDLFPLQLALQKRFTEINCQHTVLDLDYFLANRINFDITNIETQLVNIHSIITNAFEVSLTDYARGRWA